MTDFSQPINWGFKGPYLTAMIQVLNSIGGLRLVISLALYRVIPHCVVLSGMVVALAAAQIEEEPQEARSPA
ncbi:MAG: hypothetical protein V3V11_05745 [Vicinamibacteria bacterium]